MKDFARELEHTVDRYEALLRSMSNQQLSEKPNPAKWSRKEELGHLIDSAQANIRRVVASQYEQTPKLFYHQDFWVEINGYQNADPSELIDLWSMLNRRFCQIISGLSREALNRQCDIGRDRIEVVDVEFIIRDYPKHMLHHLHHLLELDPVSYP